MMSRGGAVLIDGIDVRDVTMESLRQQIGIVLQDTFLFSTTVMEKSASAVRKPATKKSSRQPNWPMPMTLSSACRTATRPCWASAAAA